MINHFQLLGPPPARRVLLRWRMWPSPGIKWPPETRAKRERGGIVIFLCIFQPSLSLSQQRPPLPNDNVFSILNPLEGLKGDVAPG